MGATTEAKGHGTEPAYLPNLPNREQGTETLAVILGLPGASLLALLTGIAVMGAAQQHGPEVWTAIALCWAGFGVLEVGLIVGALRE